MNPYTLFSIFENGNKGELFTAGQFLKKLEKIEREGGFLERLDSNIYGPNTYAIHHA